MEADTCWGGVLVTFLAGTTDGTLIIQSPNSLIFGTGQSASDVYIKEVAAGLSISQPIILPSTGIINPGGSPVLVAKADATAQAANIGSAQLYAVPANGAGMYRVSVYVVVTQAASVSSTMPNTFLNYNDADTNVAIAPSFFLTNTSTANAVGTTNSLNTVTAQNSGTVIINVKASTNIQYGTTNYASSGATPMQYAIHIKLEYLGA